MRLGRNELNIKLNILGKRLGKNFRVVNFNDCYHVMYSGNDKEQCGEVLCRGTLRECYNFVDGAIRGIELFRE